jgi:hypothetical protein
MCAPLNHTETRYSIFVTTVLYAFLPGQLITLVASHCGLGASTERNRTQQILAFRSHWIEAWVLVWSVVRRHYVP